MMAARHHAGSAAAIADIAHALTSSADGYFMPTPAAGQLDRQHSPLLNLYSVALFSRPL